MIVPVITILLLLAYAILISAITIGWWRLKVFKIPGSGPEVKVSLVVAARNEEQNISKLLNSLLLQDYPSALFEIIIVDDHSTDNTLHLAEEIILRQGNEHSVNLIALTGSDPSGKKAALSRGIQASSGELILVTDADCTAGVSWVSAISEFYRQYKPHMILGPVHMQGDGGFFAKLQTMEFTSLISSAAGSCNAGIPILANGANIAFTRQAYDSCGGFTGNMQYPSGDDMFLMMSIKEKFGARAIRFLRSAEAIVYTPAAAGINSFIQQRMRWVSKSRGYTDPILLAASITVFLTNAWLLGLALAVPFHQDFFSLFLVIYLLKMMLDFPLMLGFSRFQRTMYLMWLFPLMELLNSVYTTFIGIAGNFGKYEWKGRKV